MVGPSGTLLRPASVQEVEAELAQMMASRSRQAGAYGDRFAELWQIASECVQGGKLLRPRILLGAFDALVSARASAEVPRESIVRIAAGVELLHYAFLLHDDVIDGDVLRRGRPNLIGTILHSRAASTHGTEGGDRALGSGARHWAQTCGILMGDMLLSAAHQCFAGEALPGDLRARLLALLDRTVTESMLGELLDTAFSDRITAADLGAVLQMTRLKTATYTFELPLRAAAILAGADAADEETIGRIGAHLGIAFQLQDDLLSTFGRPELHGKDAYSDLRDGKQTAIIAYARTTDAWDDIRARFGDPRLTDEAADAMRRRLLECGAETFVRSLIDDEVHDALELAESSDASVPAELGAFLEDLVAALEGRRS